MEFWLSLMETLKLRIYFTGILISGMSSRYARLIGTLNIWAWNFRRDVTRIVTLSYLENRTIRATLKSAMLAIRLFCLRVSFVAQSVVCACPMLDGLGTRVNVAMDVAVVNSTDRLCLHEAKSWIISVSAIQIWTLSWLILRQRASLLLKVLILSVRPAPY